MRNLKRFLRWIIHKVAVALLANAIAFGIFLFAFGIHVTNSQVMKNWLSSTNTYETLINESLNLIELQATNAESEGSLGDSLSRNPFVDNSTIVDALRTTLTPEYIQEQAEEFIDGAYEWLDGKTEVPDFEFSLAAKNDELSQKLGDAMKLQFANMPNCLPEELTPTFNLLETLCRPPGIDISIEVDKLVAELAGDEGLLGTATWTGEDLIKTDDEESGLSPAQIDFARGAYSGLKDGPVILLALGVLALPLIFITSRSQYRGFNEIANTLFSGGLFTFVPAIVIARWENLITSLIGANDGATSSSVTAARSLFEPFLEAAVNDVASLTAWLSGVVLAIGTLMVLYGVYLKRIYEGQEEEQLARELAEAAEMRRIREVRMHAKKRARNNDKTRDPLTNKPLKAKKRTISKEEAVQIANDPSMNSKKVSELLQKERPMSMRKDGEVIFNKMT